MYDVSYIKKLGQSSNIEPEVLKQYCLIHADLVMEACVTIINMPVCQIIENLFKITSTSFRFQIEEIQHHHPYRLLLHPSEPTTA